PPACRRDRRAAPDRYQWPWDHATPSCPPGKGHSALSALRGRPALESKAQRSECSPRERGHRPCSRPVMSERTKLPESRRRRPMSNSVWRSVLTWKTTLTILARGLLLAGPAAAATPGGHG